MIKNISLKIFSLICIMIMYMFITNMAAAYGKYLPLYRNIIIPITFIVIIGIFNKMYQKKVKLDKVFILLMLFCVSILVPTFIKLGALNFNFSYTMLQIINSILWLLVMIYSYILAKNNYKIINKLQSFIYFLPLLLILFIKVKSYSAGTGIPLISSIYYLTMLLPILFNNKNKLLKSLGVGIIIYALLLSQKRTGLLSVGAFFIVYYFANKKMKDESLKKILKTIFIFIVSVALLSTIIYIISQNTEIPILEKMIRLKEDGGSGRVLVWEALFNKFKTSSLLSLLFGNGYNAVYYDLSMNLTAHNDFLEILYDYGLIGLTLYLTLVKILLNKGKQMLKNKNPHAPTFIASIIMALVFQLSSHLIIYPTYFLYFALYWGICLGMDSDIKNDKN